MKAECKNLHGLQRNAHTPLALGTPFAYADSVKQKHNCLVVYTVGQLYSSGLTWPAVLAIRIARSNCCRPRITLIRSVGRHYK